VAAKDNLHERLDYAICELGWHTEESEKSQRELKEKYDSLVPCHLAREAELLQQHEVFKKSMTESMLQLSEEREIMIVDVQRSNLAVKTLTDAKVAWDKERNELTMELHAARALGDKRIFDVKSQVAAMELEKYKQEVTTLRSAQIAWEEEKAILYNAVSAAKSLENVRVSALDERDREMREMLMQVKADTFTTTKRCHSPTLTAGRGKRSPSLLSLDKSQNSPLASTTPLSISSPSNADLTSTTSPRLTSDKCSNELLVRYASIRGRASKLLSL